MNIYALFYKYGLSISRLRGQGYDGACNMRDVLNDLKSLITIENQSAYGIHCFAHQLQLTIVALGESHWKVYKLFDVVARLKTIIGASGNRKDMFREKVIEGLCGSEILSERGQSLEVSLGRAEAACWGSHYKTFVNLICLFDQTIDVLMDIGNDLSPSIQTARADNLVRSIQWFEFIFCLFLMKNILGVSNDLSQALERKDHDIVNAMNLVRITKQSLQPMRKVGWEPLWEEVASFCTKRDLIVPGKEDLHVIPGSERRGIKETTILHSYRVELFENVIDIQLQELNNSFNEVNTELLVCMSCLDPSDAFSAFDERKLIRFAEFYPNDYSVCDIMALGHQLDCYIIDMRSHDQFANLTSISELSKTLVQLKKHRVYSLVYHLVKLALLLPVETATIERTLSARKLVKGLFRNRFGDALMDDCLITYIEDIVKGIDIEDIIVRFQGMSS